MKDNRVSKLDRVLAGVCRNCPVCRRARRRQTALTFWLVKQVEQAFCSFCRAYQRVYGRKAYQHQVEISP